MGGVGRARAGKGGSLCCALLCGQEAALRAGSWPGWLPAVRLCWLPWQLALAANTELELQRGWPEAAAECSRAAARHPPHCCPAVQAARRAPRRQLLGISPLQAGVGRPRGEAWPGMPRAGGGLQCRPGSAKESSPRGRPGKTPGRLCTSDPAVMQPARPGGASPGRPQGHLPSPRHPSRSAPPPRAPDAQSPGAPAAPAAAAAGREQGSQGELNAGDQLLSA